MLRINSPHKSSKVLDSLHYLSSVVYVDKKLSVPIYRRCCTLVTSVVNAFI